MIGALLPSAGPIADRPAELVALVALLALAPAALVMLTSFLKIVVVLSIARSALGAPQVPPSTAVTGLALGLSLLVRRRGRLAPAVAPVAVVARAPLGPGLGIALVEAAGRRLLVGWGKDGVRLLRDLGPREVAP